MRARTTNSAVVVLFAFASVVSYVNDADLLAVALQIAALLVFKRVAYDRCARKCSEVQVDSAESERRPPQ